MVSRASSQVMRWNLPSPLAPTRLSGYFRRSAAYTNCGPVRPLAHSEVEPRTPALKAAGLPSTRTNLPSLTWQRTPQVGLYDPQPWQKVGMILSPILFGSGEAGLNVPSSVGLPRTA